MNTKAQLKVVTEMKDSRVEEKLVEDKLVSKQNLDLRFKKARSFIAGLGPI